MPGEVLGVGTEVGIGFDLPARDPFPRYELGIAPRGSDRFERREFYYAAGTGVTKMQVPTVPGLYDVILRQANGAVVQSVPIEARFRPAPGALQLSASHVSAGEPVTVTARIPDGIWRSRPWIGLFETGRNAAGGGSIPDERLRWEYLPNDGSPLTFRMPPWHGTYEIRLFDRQGGSYVLDRQQVTVIEDAAPGVMRADQEVYEIGSPITVTMALDKDRHFEDAWIGLYRKPRELDGGALLQEVQVAWEWVNKTTMTTTFTAPNYVGEFELRLHPSGGSLPRVLDAVSFRTRVTAQPGALALPKDSYVIGEAIAFPIEWQEGRYNGGAWVGLFDTEGDAMAGQAKRSLRRLAWEWVPRENPIRFTAPAWPGTYEFRLYDRNGRYYLIDRHQITVTARPAPGALSTPKRRYEIGERFTVTANLPENRYYGSTNVALWRLRDYQVEGGAEAGTEQVAWEWIKHDTPVAFTAPAWPGAYELRLYDRDSGGFILDTLELQVVAAPRPDALRLNKEVYAVGEEIVFTVNLPDNRYIGGARLVLDNVTETTNPDRAPLEHHNHGWTWVKRETTEYRLKAPTVQGTYLANLYDRDTDPVLLARQEFRVEVPQRDLVRIQRHSYQPGDKILVQTRRPEGLPLFGPVLRLYRSSHVLPGGGLSVEQPISTYRVQPGETTVEVPAPSGPGKYEIRFYDRDSRFYILDIEEFEIIEAGLPLPRSGDLRLTPMPGEGRRTAAPIPGGAGADDAPASGETAAKEDNTPDTDEMPPANSGDGGENVDPGEKPSDTVLTDLPGLVVLVMGRDGLTPARHLSPGQSFVLEARFDQPQSSDRLTAEVDLGGGAIQVALRAEGGRTLYRSGVIRVPLTGESAQ